MAETYLIYGDCLEKMKEIPDKSVDFILTDPPYGTTACKWDSIIPFELMWLELKRIIKDNGAIALFGSEPFSSALRMSNIKMYKYDWIWHKNRCNGIAHAKKRPLNNYEIISIFYKRQCTYNPIFEPYADSVYKRFKGCRAIVNTEKRVEGGARNNIQGLKETQHILYLERGKYPTVVKFFKTPNNSNSQRFHPVEKPVALLEYLIKTYTHESEIVLDFTMGSGSTGVACKNLNRNFIGIENDEKYFEIAKNRILKDVVI